MKGNKEVLQFMIEQCNMDVEMGDANERTVIDVAAQYGNREEFLQRKVNVFLLTCGSRPCKLRAVYIPKVNRPEEIYQQIWHVHHPATHAQI